MIPKSNDASGSTPIESIPWDSSWPKWLTPEETGTVLDYFDQRFGVPSSVFDGYRWWGGQRSYGIIRDSELLERVAHLKVRTVGIIMVRDVSHYLKPTTQAVNMVGESARRNVFELDRDTLQRLLEDGDLPVPSPDPGYMILRFGGHALGCGLSLPDRLVNQLPRWMKSQLQGFLRLSLG